MSILNFFIYEFVIYAQFSILQYTLSTFSEYNLNFYVEFWPFFLGFWPVGLVVISILMAISEVVGAWAVLVYFAIILVATILIICTNARSSGNIFSGC